MPQGILSCINQIHDEISLLKSQKESEAGDEDHTLINVLHARGTMSDQLQSVIRRASEVQPWSRTVTFPIMAPHR